MLNFRDHFFAKFTFPENVQRDFTAWKVIPWADIGVMIYLPSSTSMVKFNVNAMNALRNYTLNSGGKSCMLSLEGSASSIPHSERYSRYDDKFFNDLINDSSYLTFIKDNEEVTPDEFISLVEEEFYSLLQKKFTASFKIMDDNVGYLDTTITPNYISIAKATFKRAFNKCRRTVNPKENHIYDGKNFIGNNLIDFNNAIKEMGFKKLKRDLEKNLSNDSKPSKVMKI